MTPRRQEKVLFLLLIIGAQRTWGSRPARQKWRSTSNRGTRRFKIAREMPRGHRQEIIVSRLPASCWTDKRVTARRARTPRQNRNVNWARRCRATLMRLCRVCDHQVKRDLVAQKFKDQDDLRLEKLDFAVPSGTPPSPKKCDRGECGDKCDSASWASIGMEPEVRMRALVHAQ